MIRTVLGDIAASDLGATNYHEHLFQVSPLLPGDELSDEAASAAEAALLRDSGFEAMVDATPVGLGRNPAALARISATHALSIVATTGTHREAHYPGDHPLRALKADALAELFSDDIERGMPASDAFLPAQVRAEIALTPAGEPVRAGLIKAGIGYWAISSFERETLDAVAIAHRHTARPVMVHLEFCTAAHEVLDILAAQGVSAERVVLAHADRVLDAGLHLSLVERGAWLGYDGAARSKQFSDEQLLELTERVVRGGGAGRILLGGDVARATRYIAYGGMPGLAYLGNRYVPRLRECIGEPAVEQLTVANPALFLDAR
ncbi:phosphotriesterase [Salinibacterium sp. NK8237]|uniref:phosphotriesterase family protein n=1 Tax=Salinibacterium sp. NK8237 TaxID=2792038 RepID=UPI0018CE06EB|nr:aryldialkylphosphatase [Salinibacterium sp. NK8237]MBH0130193.1 aryldialkylphosphatase [Salinibacterium sp. NK8237]